LVGKENFKYLGGVQLTISNLFGNCFFGNRFN
jgi:hypothetical protein